ncbi:hypothetical protein GSI_04187 [Ganoderma sinense ZZ0214-1]|uniref:Thioester reductase (TE) domain-containing protein n=1 Tax=Ganoderma sinense ZZ0214-1 TaxID=1077348 RepID=A0A2G8SIH3_9APHY|nr:hypothetical protein GSI_04187 [Ganoderma sinense ZZ0214-1]
MSMHLPEITPSIPRSRTPQDLWRFVDRFSANLPVRPTDLVDRPTGYKDVVLITGTTGGLGCDALEHLLRDENVGLVYAFNRKNSHAMERQRLRFAARGLDGSLLNSPKFQMVEAVLHEPDFGLDAELLEEIRGSVTHIILNAWKVNFNVPVTAFEQDIQSVRNFVDFALSSPYIHAPAVVFVGSIAVLDNWKKLGPVPELPIDDPACAFGKGYSESKWVPERVLQNVTRERGLRTIVVRVGQIEGDRMGHWNEREWFPSLVKSALFQKCLPKQDGDITWIPCYEAAQALTELRHSSDPIVHLVHPRPVPWDSVLEPIARELNVPFVPYRTWLSTLEGSVVGEPGSTEQAHARRRNPALRLLPFYREQEEKIEEAHGPEREAMGFVFLSTDKAVRVSESLASLPETAGERALMWLAAWRKSGFLSTSWKGKL